MRELKFRGYDEESKCFRYGYYTKLTEGIRRFDAIISDIDGVLTRFYIHNPETIEQFTGLKDKNGKEIYEGDILGYNGSRFIVEWDMRHGQYKCRMTETDDFYCTVDDNYIKELFEVIGNIHQNPDLLESL